MDFSLLHCSQGYPYKPWGHIHNQSATKISMVNKAHSALKRTKKTKLPILIPKGPDVIHVHTLRNGVQKCHLIQRPEVIESQRHVFWFFSHTEISHLTYTPNIINGILLYELNARITKTRNLKSKSAGIQKITHFKCIYTPKDPSPSLTKQQHPYHNKQT